MNYNSPHINLLNAALVGAEPHITAENCPQALQSLLPKWDFKLAHKTRLPIGHCENKLPNGFWGNQVSYWQISLCKTRFPIGLFKRKRAILQCKTKLTIGSCKPMFPLVMYKTRLPAWPSKASGSSFLQNDAALCLSLQIYLFLCPPRDTYNCGAVLCRLAEALHKTPFFSSLCREAVNENMTAEQLHLMWQEASPIYFDWPCFTQAPATFPMRATMHSDLRCGNLKCGKPTVWAGEHEWKKKTRVPPESALLSAVICILFFFFCSPWSLINCYYTGIVWNQGQVTHIHECTCGGARCHERSGQATAAATKKPRHERQLVLFLNTWLSFSACLRMEGN